MSRRVVSRRVASCRLVSRRVGRRVFIFYKCSYSFTKFKCFMFFITSIMIAFHLFLTQTPPTSTKSYAVKVNVALLINCNTNLKTSRSFRHFVFLVLKFSTGFSTYQPGSQLLSMVRAKDAEHASVASRTWVQAQTLVQAQKFRLQELATPRHQGSLQC